MCVTLRIFNRWLYLSIWSTFLAMWHKLFNFPLGTDFPSYLYQYTELPRARRRRIFWEFWSSVVFGALFQQCSTNFPRGHKFSQATVYWITARHRRKILRIFDLQSYLEHFSSNVAEVFLIFLGGTSFPSFPDNCISSRVVEYHGIRYSGLNSIQTRIPNSPNSWIPNSPNTE
jgi:hypothetical protein